MKRTEELSSVSRARSKFAKPASFRVLLSVTISYLKYNNAIIVSLPNLNCSDEIKKSQSFVVNQEVTVMTAPDIIERP